LLRELLKDKTMRGPALRGLAAYDEPTTPAILLKMYATLNDAEKADAVSTLASRPAYALALLDAVEKGTVARTDVSPVVARQLLALKDKRVEDRLTKVWGAVRAPAKDKAAQLARYKKLATPDALKKANRSNGRAVFAKHCASCHVLFGEGTKLGPDL